MNLFALESCEFYSRSCWRVWCIVTFNNNSRHYVILLWFYRSSSVIWNKRRLTLCYKKRWMWKEGAAWGHDITQMSSTLERCVSVSMKCFCNSCFISEVKEKSVMLHFTYQQQHHILFYKHTHLHIPGAVTDCCMDPKLAGCSLV